MKVLVTYRKDNITHIRLIGMRPSKRGCQRGLFNYVSDVLGGTLMYVDVLA